MTNINIKVTEWYSKKEGFEKFKIDCESEGPSKWGLYMFYETEEDIAKAILLEVKKHNETNPMYIIEPDKGSHPLKKVKKYNDYEYSAKPEPKVIKRIERLLRNGIMSSEEGRQGTGL